MKPDRPALDDFMNRSAEVLRDNALVMANLGRTTH